ncbi:hypothetical protein A2696_04065 [Candidatus Curtissbacteria bacterium RIFCSPHIGHO2_01_FULL_41_13]|uniref:Antitoxin n=2 Tax=Microgenomates group TaxID=1794810 RepID=A0A1F5G2F7_9BACT|nr:MAG: hypothetical protein A2696_04065 [Candidatus Curtissbacteria bacterium RIFCSPHIGHO2_01_FULL_41_13]OGK42140.1 MAG: hypothetical protein A3A74_06520 [Candidatus Roizmanbacteria bacterium RIFCSPLOWO2_01_FULL_35_13]
MLQSITMLDLRKKIGEIVDQSFYRKERFLIKRKDKPVAVLVPIEDYELFIGDEKDIEIYSDRRIRQFLKEDKLTKKQKAAVQKLLEK